MASLDGIIEGIIFRSDDTGFSVLEVRTGEQLLTAVGELPPLFEGERVQLQGEWVAHRDYGEQLRVRSCSVIPPATMDDIQRYLGSGVIKGIGPSTAASIVEAFGEEALEVLQYTPERLVQIRGISEKRADVIAASYAEQMDTRDVMMGLQVYGISINQAMKMYKTYGVQAIAKVRENPYTLIDDIFGIGFKIADRIAANMKIEKTAPVRIAAGIRFVLSWARNEGHVFLPKVVLVRVAAEQLGVDESFVDDAIDEQVILNRLVLNSKNSAIYLPWMYNAENGFAKRIAMLAAQSGSIVNGGVDTMLKDLEKESGIVLEGQQREAVLKAMESNISIITGGPGTGKTTIIRFVLSRLTQLGLSVELAAPTGRAAKRMTEATGFEARTIHRLLEYSREDEFLRNEEYPLDCDALVIDEMSMVDIQLAYQLGRALSSETRLIMVGDVDQLPSVGPGNVLRDLINSNAVPCIRLTEIFRQEAQSMIIENAHRVNTGKSLNIAGGGDFIFDRINDASVVLEDIISLFRDDPRTAGYDPLRQIQAMAGMKKGVLGVNNLNTVLQNTLNPPERGKLEREVGDGLLREGDKVMQIRNNYQMEWVNVNGFFRDKGTGVFNGDMGIVQRIDNEDKKLTVLFDDDRLAEYDFSQLDELQLAYCISIHKSQGSEFPVVIVPMVKGPSQLMTRNLLYTALTRAREKVFLIGRQEVANIMIGNNHIANRNSYLAEFIKEWMGIYDGIGKKD